MNAGTRAARSRRGLPGAAFLLLAALAGTPVSAASFRPLEGLPRVPVELDGTSEREMLRADADRLESRAVEIAVRRQLYERDCGNAAYGAASQRDCQFRLVDLRRDAARFNTDAYALGVYFRRVAGEVAMRRSAGRAAEAAAPASPDRRLGYVRAALAVKEASWAAAVAQARAQVSTRAGDPALRDAVAYLEAMRDGAIGAANLENEYYRHGVRRFLAGDDWSAALAFARAARDDPGDLRVFDSYARAVRRQHEGPACRKSGRCVGGDVAVWTARFGTGQAAAAKAFLAAARRAGTEAAIRASAMRLRGFAIYAARETTGAPVPEEASAAAALAVGHVNSGDWTAAAAAWTEAWRLSDPGRADIFLASYAGRPSDAARPGFAEVRDALSHGAADPFAGALTTAQIVRLQR